jgi:membrane protein DedA with SNARE-associated domain
MQIFHHLARLLLSLFGGHELEALFGLLTVEEAGIPLPVPGDMLVMFAGEHHRHSPAYDLSIVAISSAAVFAGSSLLYYVARQGGRPLVERLSKHMHLGGSRLERLERWFRRHGLRSIVLGRLIPGLRIPTTVMAGLSDVPYRVYAPTAALAALIWSAIYFWLGVAIHHELRQLTALIAGVPDMLSDALALWIVIALCLLIGLGGTWHLRRHSRARGGSAHGRHASSDVPDGTTTPVVRVRVASAPGQHLLRRSTGKAISASINARSIAPSAGISGSLLAESLSPTVRKRQHGRAGRTATGPLASDSVPSTPSGS